MKKNTAGSLAVTFGAALLLIAIPASAGKPTKPGGGGSGSDPCTVPGLDFPAFIYWKPSGQGQQIYVADATGKCSRAVITVIGANGAAFSYPVGAGNVGRIVFPGNGTIDSIDFTVNHSDNTITLGDSTPLFDNWNLGGFELSPDGTTVYYWISADSPQSFATLHKVTIGGPPPSEQPIYQSLAAGAFLATTSVSGDGSTLVVEQITNSPELHQILRISLPCSDASACTTVLAESANGANWPALDLAGDKVIYSDLLSGYNSCYQLRVLDAGTGQPLFAGTQPRYGTLSSWLGNMLLVNGRTSPNRKGTCSETGLVTLIDPATGEETPLVSGYGPDGK